MKKLSGFIVLSLVLILGVLFYTTVPSDIYADPKFRTSDKNRVDFGTVMKEFLTKQTSVYEILPAITREKYVIDSFIISASATGKFFFSEDGTAMFPSTILKESDPLVVPNTNINFSTGEGVDLDVTGINGPSAIWLEYHTE